jgi:hypothetical protein
LAPVQAEPWAPEVEALARRLQATSYSEHWPATDLFCSVLLADGRRVVALARYGLADHTPSHRRGGLELLGVLGPAYLEVSAALAIYQALKRRRSANDDLHGFGGCFSLAELTTGAQAVLPQADPMPVLPVRLWQDGALLFAAASPSDPDHHLRLLEQNAGNSWQWLPLVGPDFPLAAYAQRGPVIAWTPHLAGVALKIDRKSAEIARLAPAHSTRGMQIAFAVLLVVVIGMLAANMWSTLVLTQQLAVRTAVSPSPTNPETPPATHPAATAPVIASADGRERFAAALAKLLRDRGALREGDSNRTRLLARYDRLVHEREGLQLSDENADGKLAVALISVLADRNADHIEEVMQKALANKGFSDRLVKLASELVREQFAVELRDEP